MDDITSGGFEKHDDRRVNDAICGLGGQLRETISKKQLLLAIVSEQNYLTMVL
jgi:hypothetical protein